MPFIPPKVKPDGFDQSVETVVPVIASFNTNGSIKPLYVRINDVPLQITDCWCQPFSGYMKYHCSVLDNNHLKDITLSYFPERKFWTVRL